MAVSLRFYAAFLTLFTAAFAIMPRPTISKSAIINIDAIWDGPNSASRNETFRIPLGTIWKHKAFTGLNTIYLIGAEGNVNVDSIHCYPYWVKPNGMGYSGLELTKATPTSPYTIFADLHDASLQLTCNAV